MNLYLALYLMVSALVFGGFAGADAMTKERAPLREWMLVLFLALIWPFIGATFLIERLKK